MIWKRRTPRRAMALPPLPPLPEPRVAAPPIEAAAPAAAIEPVQQAPAAEIDAGRMLDAPALSPGEQWERLAAAAAALDDAFGPARLLAAGGTYPRRAWDRFRRDHPLRPPPGPLPDASGTLVVVDASFAAPYLLRETLRSLQDQTANGWRCLVLAPAATRAHPVGSFADTDPRIAFADPAMPAAEALAGAARVLVAAVGARLDPNALAWLLFAAARTGGTAFADHDRGVIVPGLGPVRDDPWLYWANDAAALPHLPAPALVLADAALAAETMRVDGGEGWRRAILSRSAHRAAHVPRMLATMVELPLIARGGRPVPEDALAGHLSAAPFVAPSPEVPEDETPIAVIVPTRDGAAMLRRAVESMRATARRPERVAFLVVDNRSVEAETAALLAQWAEAGIARTIPFDRAFNWALINNHAAGETDAPVLVFANNDLEMTRRGWDDALLAALAPGVGAVGARLLYPNRTIQHGGIVFGMGPGHPEHEGREVPAMEPGPGRRLVIPRTVAAVTGAFLGCRRGDFEAMGGFDAATMFVGHSDIDFCLKLRETGLTIRYEPRIEAIHYESITRGRNETKAQVAWDEGERAELIDRWGVSLTVDPGVNPHWAKGGVPFEAYREPAMSEIVRHIDLTGRARPWQPTRRDEQEALAWRPEAIPWG